MRLSTLLRPVLWLLLACLVTPVVADEFLDQLSIGVNYRRQGHLTLAIEALGALRERSSDPRQRALASGELGAALLQARRLGEAEAQLKTAYDFFGGVDRARYAIDLGNLAAARKKRPEARALFREAMTLAGDDKVLAVTAALNDARATPRQERGKALAALVPQLEGLAKEHQARLRLNLGNQARVVGAQHVRLAYEQLEQARRLAEAGQDLRLRLEVHDALAQLYEDQQRKGEALRLTQHALGLAQTATAKTADLLIPLYWRQGRIAVERGETDLALASYRAAVDQIEAIRQDIPIEYEDNRSSFRDTLEPIYLGLADLQLAQADKLQGEARNAALRQVRAVVELIKQTEMQDYLGDRCSVVADASAEQVRLPVGTAVLYPIIFANRLDLLLETPNGMVRRSTAVSGQKLRQVSQEFARQLRSDPDAQLPQARQLYDWLLRPLEGDLAAAGVKTLVVVPDGVIRLLPLAALHDGKRYLIETTAVATAPGLTMVQAALGKDEKPASLIAGLSEPGPVIDKLSAFRLNSILQPGSGTTSRSLKGNMTVRAVPADLAKRQAKDALRLPGVKTEVEALSRQLGSRPLLDDTFTLAEFSSSVGSGRYDVVHIASHGVFGGSGEESFILAYDEVLTMDRLQQLLRSDNLRRRPIKLLTLSACETAEGNERAPLGIAGAALKAKAETALGTLWPVEDGAATSVMNRFYQGLIGERLSRAEALRQAQVELLRRPEYKHPFFWAPFIIVGNWN